MKKKYVAKTDVAVNIVMAPGVNKHIGFTSLTGGHSVYYTEDEREQAGLESHYRFGSLFKLEPILEEPEVDIDEPGADKTVINVTDLDSARNELSERLGISRTKLRTKVQIKAVCEENNIELAGLEW